MNELQVGSLVKFRDGLYEDEAGVVYRVVEINGDRCFIESQFANLLFNPVSVANVSELELIEEEEM